MNHLIQIGDYQALLQEAQLLADDYQFDPVSDDSQFPEEGLHQIFRAGFCSAPLPARYGGAGLGTETGSQASLLALLQELGRANLSLARIYEGHLNAVILVFAYGSSFQKEQTAAACLAGKLLSVWNTDGTYPTTLQRQSDGTWNLSGQKAFASAAHHAELLLVTADFSEGGGRQMCLIPADEAGLIVEEESWQPLGMQGSDSCKINFLATHLTERHLVGTRGDYYCPPFFLGGAIRTSAAHLGGAVCLLQNLRNFVRNRPASPLLHRRVALAYAAVETGKMWIHRSASVAERSMKISATETEIAEVHFAANITRVVIEKVCSEVIQLVTESVGARGLNQPYRFAALVRDLTMFLRQPDPDRCISEAGRFVLENAHA